MNSEDIGKCDVYKNGQIITIIVTNWTSDEEQVLYTDNTIDISTDVIRFWVRQNSAVLFSVYKANNPQLYFCILNKVLLTRAQQLELGLQDRLGLEVVNEYLNQ